MDNALSKKERNKERIQQAAYKCVARYGFEKTTLDDIAKEVGLNKASLYYYYKNKEEIFLEVTASATRAFMERLQNSVPQKTGIAAQIEHYLYERSLYYIRMVEEVRISEETLRQAEPLFYQLVKDVEAREAAFIKKLLDAAVQKGELGSVDTALLAVNLIDLSEAVKRRAKENHPAGRDTGPLGAEILERLRFILGLVFKGLH
jgi:AcrR family transcriptional regulator